MKKSFLFAFMGAVVLWTTTACEPNVTEKPQKQAIELTSGSTEQTLWADSSQGAGSISFTTTGAWTSSVSGVEASARTETSRAGASWVRLSPSAGSSAGAYTVSIELDTNYLGVARAAVIAISSGDKELAISVTQQGMTQSGEIPVLEIPVRGVSLNESLLTLSMGESAALTATVLPADATDRTVTWDNSDPGVVSFEEGTLRALAPGSARLTVTTRDGGFQRSCVVMVRTSPVEGGGDPDGWGNGGKINL